MFKIPVYQPYLTGNIKKYVNDCLDSSWISSKGKYISLFEAAFKKYIGSEYAVGVCNGTVALHLALVALGIGPGDEVIVPALTYVASANAIAYTGAIPVFVDSREDSWQMDPEEVQKKISSRTKAVMAVHLYGHPCDLDPLVALCRLNGLYLIEDCAEAFGSCYKGRHVGTAGDVGTFSFFGNKTITTGEGGMVVCQDSSLYEKLQLYKGQGVSSSGNYWHEVIGYNYRMTNICAAIGLSQIEIADQILERKLRIAKSYEEKLQGLPISFHKPIGDVSHSYWMCSILTHEKNIRDKLREFLASYGVETRPFFYPVHHLPMYKKESESYPGAEDLSGRGINLPSYPELSELNVQMICDLIQEFYLCSKHCCFSDAVDIAAAPQIST